MVLTIIHTVKRVALNSKPNGATSQSPNLVSRQIINCLNTKFDIDLREPSHSKDAFHFTFSRHSR